MKVLHTSDWHLGQHFYGKSRAAEHQAFLNWLLSQVESHQIDAVVIAGDVFDTGTPPSYARELYFDFVGKMNQLGCTLVVLAGNHDSVAMLSESRSVLGYLNTHVIAIAGLNTEEQIIPLTSRDGHSTVTLCAIPFIRPRDVVKSQAGQSTQEKQQALQQAIADHYQLLFDQAKQTAPNSPVLMTGHLTTVGASTSDSVREIYIGTLEAFPAAAFPDADYIALGHIHKPQLVGKAEQIRYCGSPIPLSFDEASQQKQVVLVEFSEEKTPNITPIDVPTFQPMAMLKTDIDNLADEIAALSKNLFSEDSVERTLWLDIEIMTTGYLQDIAERVAKLTKDLPIEVLMIRRNKSQRQLINQADNKVTLNELTPSEVFKQRLLLEQWPDEAAEQRKQRLSNLFTQFEQEEANDENS